MGSVLGWDGLLASAGGAGQDVEQGLKSAEYGVDGQAGTGTETSLSPWHPDNTVQYQPYDARLDVLVDQQVAEVLADLL